MRSIVILFLVLYTAMAATGQQKSKNTIITALNSLSIAPDARSTGMGITGAATSPDAFSTYWNPGKLSFLQDDYGCSVGYTPWLSKLVKSVGLASFTGYKKTGDYSVIGLDIRYFSMGKIDFKDETGYDIYSYSPSEYALGITYSMQLSDYAGFGASFRYIRSQPALGVEFEGQAVKTANAIGGDIGYYYCNVPLANQESLVENVFRFGAAITNIGTKVSYYPGSSKSFQPTNLRLGVSYTFANANSENTFTLNADINKLLVPTPPERDSTGMITAGKDPDVSIPAAIFSSFADAPGGMGEEFQEFGIGVGLEYAYRSSFFLRSGLYYENESKGNKQVITAGFGYRSSNFYMDLSYFAPYVPNNQLAQTFRISLGINIQPY